MKNAILLLLLSCAGVAAQDVVEKFAPVGQLIIEPFASAPFPHPERAKGHYYHTNFYSAAAHYSDNHVALFVPKGFHAGRSIDFVVHFHGWGNNITNALSKYHLIDQFVASHRNAILITPEGPVNASDSFDGKLEDPDGFKRFMAEAMETLRQHGVIKTDKIGKIILSGHSGGYEVISSIVAWGGLSDHVREVWLFDALYAGQEKYEIWFDHHKGRFIDIYTDHGGTRDNTIELMAILKGNQVPYFDSEEMTATARDLKDNHLVFLHSALPHDEVMQKNEAFRRFLESSSLGEISH